MKERLYELKELILEQFFPATCPFCGKVISFREDSCACCAEKLSLFDEPVCLRCGKTECICERLSSIDEIAAPFSYEEHIEKAIDRFKFRDHPEYAKAFAKQIAGKLGTDRVYDAIAFVPMDRGRQKERGYNQAEELANALGECLNLPVLADALVKTKKTAQQHLLPLDERRENLQKAFTPGEDKVDGLRLLLCDDVVTTGITMDQCAKTLKENGAASVTGAAFASVQRRLVKR